MLRTLTLELKPFPSHNALLPALALQWRAPGKVELYTDVHEAQASTLSKPGTCQITTCNNFVFVHTEHGTTKFPTLN